MHAVKRVAKNTGILYAKMAITMFISLSSTRLVLTALGAEDFGIFNLVGGVVSMLGFLNASMAERRVAMVVALVVVMVILLSL